MTKDKLQIPCLNEKIIDQKRIYNYRQWLKRFEQYTKKIYNIDIGLQTEKGTITETEWNTKEEKTQQNFLCSLRLEATHQIPLSKYQTEPDKIEIDKLIKL